MAIHISREYKESEILTGKEELYGEIKKEKRCIAILFTKKLKPALVKMLKEQQVYSPCSSK
jgi:hypothetical protein